MFKKVCFISLLFFSLNAHASHDVCIAIYPTPPECLHDEGDDNKSDDNKNILIAGAVVAGVYFYFKKDKDINSYNINDGLTLYKGKKIKVSFLSNRLYQHSEHSYQPATISSFNEFYSYPGYNILTFDLSPGFKRH